jgi:hypothetical protein
MYRGHKKEPTIILEAVTSKGLWIWHAFFRMLGSHNDINILQRCPIFARLAEGQGSQVNYKINGNDYSMSYYLIDETYPSWATFVKIIPESWGNKKKYFSKAQKACRKDIERAFGVLQSRFAIVCESAHLWDEDSLGNIMMVCIIMHNMIVEDKFAEKDDLNYDHMGEKVTVSHDDAPELKLSLQTIGRSRIWLNTCGKIIQIYTILLVQSDLNYVG